MFRLFPREEQFFDLFERQARHIVESAGQLRDMIFDFSDAAARAAAIKELEHAGDVLTHELIRKINTTFVTPFDREDVYALASRLDDVLDLIEAASDRLVLYRIKAPTSGARALGEVIVKAAAATQAAVGCLRPHSALVPRPLRRDEPPGERGRPAPQGADRRALRRRDGPHRGHQVEGDLRDPRGGHGPVRGRGERHRRHHAQDGLRSAPWTCSSARLAGSCCSSWPPSS